jgi:hypothetical protein
MMKEQAMTIVFTRILLPLALRQAGLSHPRLRLKQQRGRTFTSSAVLRWWAARSPQAGSTSCGSRCTRWCWGRAKALFKSVEHRQRLALIEARPLNAGPVSLLYTVR